MFVRGRGVVGWLCYGSFMGWGRAPNPDHGRGHGSEITATILIFEWQPWIRIGITIGRIAMTAVVCPRDPEGVAVPVVVPTRPGGGNRRAEGARAPAPLERRRDEGRSSRAFARGGRGRAWPRGPAAFLGGGIRRGPVPTFRTLLPPTGGKTPPPLLRPGPPVLRLRRRAPVPGAEGGGGGSGAAGAPRARPAREQ